MNYMEKVAEMLGVESYAPFKIKELMGCMYVLTSEGLFSMGGLFGGSHSQYETLNNLLTGKYTIQKLPQKPILTEDEKVILRNIDKEYKWIARDMDGCLWIYPEKPQKYDDDKWWISGVDSSNINLYKHLFQFIKWEDDEPYLIEDLLGE